jgi:prepilin signal peptidase PulO-like enzyme (type II secretory pathway)
MSAADWRARIIPDVFLFPFMLTGLVLGVTGYGLPWIPGGIFESVIAACIGYALGAVLNIIFKIRKKQNTNNEQRTTNNDYDPIGMGDIKLLGAGGIWLGVVGLSWAVAGACILGIIWGLARRQKYVPFAPFFFVGAIGVIIFLIL